MTELLEEILQYLPGPRSGEYEHELACKRLRALLLYDRLEILKGVMAVDIPFALKIATNALGDNVSDREFVRPGLLTGDYDKMKHYLRFGAHNTRIHAYLNMVAEAQPRDYARLSRFAYYYPVFLGGNAKAKGVAFHRLLAEMQAEGHLDFDPETWEGGPNDVQWFADFHAAHPIWYPPIRALIERHKAA
jgi:hypothetical protein